jgi:hypothetical protein
MLVYPQKVTLYQVGDLVEGASFNNFLDAIDGSYCTSGGGDDPKLWVHTSLALKHADMRKVIEFIQTLLKVVTRAQKTVGHLQQLPSSAPAMATMKQIFRLHMNDVNAMSKVFTIRHALVLLLILC